MITVVKVVVEGRQPWGTAGGPIHLPVHLAGHYPRHCSPPPPACLPTSLLHFGIPSRRLRCPSNHHTTHHTTPHRNTPHRTTGCSRPRAGWTTRGAAPPPPCWSPCCSACSAAHTPRRRPTPQPQAAWAWAPPPPSKPPPLTRGPGPAPRPLQTSGLVRAAAPAAAAAGLWRRRGAMRCRLLPMGRRWRPQRRPQPQRRRLCRPAAWPKAMPPLTTITRETARAAVEAARGSRSRPCPARCRGRRAAWARRVPARPRRRRRVAGWCRSWRWLTAAAPAVRGRRRPQLARAASTAALRRCRIEQHNGRGVATGKPSNCVTVMAHGWDRPLGRLIHCSADERAGPAWRRL